MSELVERWPGYSEQSWSERFAELDRRYRAEQQDNIKALMALHESYIAAAIRTGEAEQ